MSGEGSNDLPQFYGSKTADGEIVKRPREGEVTALGVVASPTRAYHPRERQMSPERGATESDAEGSGRIGLRRRTSAPGMAPRAQTAGEYDTRPSFTGKRPMRLRDDAYWDERDYDRGYRRREDPDYHPDSFERSNRPPRSYKNYDAYSSKPYIEETRSDYYQEDEPRTPNRRRRRGDYDEESLDGYNYNGPHHRGKPVSFANLSKEERAEVLRLPWTEWMNSDFKNR